MKKGNLLSAHTSTLLFVKIALIITLTSNFSISTSAQLFGNPTISLLVEHPPTLPLKFKKIAFAPASGTCSDELANALVSELVSRGIEVIERENLQTVLKEHSFTLTSSVDQTSAASIGKILGPSALIFIKVTRCTSQQDKLYNTERKYNAQGIAYVAPVYISRTRAFLTVSIQVIDLSSTKTLAAQTFNYSPEKSNKSNIGYVEFPTTFEVQDMAIKSAVEEVNHMFLPWSESKTFEFYDDKDFNMKEAYKTLKRGDIPGAFNLTLQGFEECQKDTKVKDKTRVHVYYNMAICHMLTGNFNSALKILEEAKKYKPEHNVFKAYNECVDAIIEKNRSESQESAATNELKKQKEEENKKIQAEEESTLTNKSIIDMVALKIPEAIIIQKIKSSKCKFDTTPDALATLTKSGVGEKIMMAMIEKQ
jgi:hypothetical protein